MRHAALDALDEIEKSLGKYMMTGKKAGAGLSADPTGSPFGKVASNNMPKGRPSTMKMPGPNHKGLEVNDIPSNVNLPKEGSDHAEPDGDEEYEGQHNPGGHAGHSFGGRHKQAGNENFHYGRKKGG